MMNKNQVEVKLIPFDPFKATSEEWNELHDYRKRYHNENMSDFPPIEDGTYEKNIKALKDSPNIDLSSFRIIKNGKMVGTMGIRVTKESSKSYEKKKNELNFNVKLLKKYRRLGIGSIALAKVYEFAQKDNKTLFTSESFHEDGKNFLRKVGAQEGLVVRTNRLEFDNFDWDMVKNWIKEAESKNPDLKLKFYTIVPEEIIQSFCDVATETSNQTPQDNLQTGSIVITPDMHRGLEKQIANAGANQDIAVILDKDNKILGLTFLISMPEDNFLEQQITGVLINQRGKKLGKWLKAGLLLHVKEKYPNKKYIITKNAESNDAMLAVNRKLGFKRLREEIIFQLSLKDLTDYLQAKNLI